MYEFCIIRINLILILVIALWLILAFDTWDLQKRRVQQTRSPCALSILMDPRRELRHLCKADRVTAETHGHTPSPCSRYSKHKKRLFWKPTFCISFGFLCTSWDASNHPPYWIDSTVVHIFWNKSNEWEFLLFCLFSIFKRDTFIRSNQ